MISSFFRPIFLPLYMAFVLLSPHANGQENHDHGDHNHNDVHAVAKQLTLTPVQMANLGVTSVEIEIRSLQESVELLCSVEVLPERQAYVSPRFNGQIREIRTTLGDQVTVGQGLVVIEPIIAGAPTLTLRAPLSGIVSKQSARIGQTVEAMSVLFEISDHSRMLLHGTMMESSDITRIRADQLATIQLDALPGKSLVAKVSRVYMAREAGTGLFTVHAETDNEAGLLYPGMIGTMSVAVGSPILALVVPRRAIIGSMGERFIFVQAGDVFERRAVIEGLASGPDIEVLEGVFPGERVVVQGHYQLQYMGEGAAGLPTDAHAGHSH